MPGKVSGGSFGGERVEDCRLELTVKDGKVGLKGENLSLVELAGLCGVLQVIAGTDALKRGMDLDTVKNNMLDVHLEAMRRLDDVEV